MRRGWSTAGIPPVDRHATVGQVNPREKGRPLKQFNNLAIHLSPAYREVRLAIGFRNWQSAELL